MRIQDIKHLSDNPKVSRIFGYFWDIPEYQQAMWNYRSVEAGAYGLLTILGKTFAKLYADKNGELNHEARTQRDDLRKLSRLIYGDADAWCANTAFEAVEAEYKRRTSEKRSQTKERVTALAPLAARLPEGENSIQVLFDIAGNDEQYAAVSPVINDISSVSELLDICIECARKNGTKFGFRDDDKRLVKRLNELCSNG